MLIWEMIIKMSQIHIKSLKNILKIHNKLYTRICKFYSAKMTKQRKKFLKGFFLSQIHPKV